MFCSRCGVENSEGAAFCKNCGNSLGKNAVTPPAAPVYTVHNKAKAPLSSNPVVNAVKQVASSPLALVAIIAFSAMVLVSLISSLVDRNALTAAIYSLLNSLTEAGVDVPYEIYNAIDSAYYSLGSGLYVFASILGLIPSILICVGLWLTYSSAASRSSDGMKTSGLTTIKVINIIQLVGTCIAFAFIELLIIIIGIAASSVAREYSYYYDYSSGASLVATIGVVIPALIVAAVYTLQIIYQAKVIQSVNTAKKTITTGVPSDKISGFVAVWLFISAGFSLFGLATNFLGCACSITSLICFGILIYKYRNAMRAIMCTPTLVAHVEPVTPAETETPITEEITEE